MLGLHFNIFSGWWLLPGLPPSFKLPLVSQEVTEGNSVVLRCELNKPAPSVEWRRGGELLKNGDKYQMKKKDLQVEMKITDLSLDDTGDYACVCGEQRTTARIMVNGEFCIHYSKLQFVVLALFTILNDLLYAQYCN